MKKDTLLLWIIAFIIVLMYFNKYQMQKCSKYTIAKGIDISGGYKNNFSIKYSYLYDGQLFWGSNAIDTDYYNKYSQDRLINKKIFIQFACADPKKSNIIWDTYPSDTLVVPLRGWDSLPK